MFEEKKINAACAEEVLCSEIINYLGFDF